MSKDPVDSFPGTLTEDERQQKCADIIKQAKVIIAARVLSTATTANGDEEL